MKKTEERKQTKVNNSLPKMLPGNEAAAKYILKYKVKNREVNILQRGGRKHLGIITGEGTAKKKVILK